MNLLIIITILLPIIGGFAIPFLPFKNDHKKRNFYSFILVAITSVLVVFMMIGNMDESLYLLSLGTKMNISFKVDGLSKIFLGLIAVLWPIAILYSFEYMHHDKKQVKFFTFYIATYGVAIGLACSASLITFYLLYEMLTFITLPLVMHSMDKRSIAAGRKYLIYSIAGAAMAFIGIMILLEYGVSLDFVYGGTTYPRLAERYNLILVGYLLCFFGFGVKAAIFPFHGWLPSAGVAPTPVTALLHAVAVVKAGVFAIARVTYFSFGTTILVGTFAQNIAMAFAIFTIIFGSAWAWKQNHLKRRLAYSTISNLSYIVFGLTLMTPLGLAAAMAHMLFHGIIKICLFFCVGGVMEQTHKEYLPEIEGYGRVMPKTFIAFTLGAMALSGIPLFAGFISKVALGDAALAFNTPLAYLGVIILLISAIFTAAYTFEVSIKAFFPHRLFDNAKLKGIKDPTWLMTVPFGILCFLMIYFGLFSSSLLDVLKMIANGIV